MNVDWDYGATPAVPDAGADFYQRGEFADQRIALSHLRSALAGRRAIERCGVIGVWYAPARDLTVIYRISSAGIADTILTVRFHGRGEGPKRHAVAAAAASDADAVVLLRDWDAVGWIFPEDPKLKGLGDLVEAESIRNRLSGVADVSRAAGEMSWSLLNYRPGERCVVRCRWPEANVDLVGKVQPGAIASHRAMERLWSLPQRAFGMARPVTCEESLGMRWEAFAPGRRIEAVAAEIGLHAALQRVMTGLVGLHGTALPDLPGQGPQEILQRLERKVMPRIRGGLPALAGAGESFVARLSAAAETLPPRSPTVIHGDLHTANVLLSDDAVVLIDLDSLSRGNPAYDLALFGSRLLLVAAMGKASSAETEVAVAELPGLYVAAGGVEIPAQVFAWYLAALLVGRQIKTCVRHLAPGMHGIAPLLLRRATDILDAGRVEPGLSAG